MNLPLLNIVLIALLYFPIRIVLRYRSNLNAAKVSGLPYSSTPFYFFNNLWMLASTVVLPTLTKILPQKWQGRWLRLMHPDFAWREGYEAFHNSDISIGSDTFILTCPETNIFVTADPAVITQITTRRADFPKPIALYEGISVYGTNVVTTEGSTWRRHRKNTIPPFGEKNNRVVWKESIFQAGQMLQHWMDSPSKEKDSALKPDRCGALVTEPNHDTMRLSLYVISRAGFDVRCQWPGQSSGSQEGAMSALEVPKGHKMSYMDSLETLLIRIIAVFIAPVWLLDRIPLEYCRLAALSFREWGQYMNEIYEKKKSEILQSKNVEEEGLDLMGAMIRTSGQIPGSSNYGKPDAGLSKDEILGNSFILFLAGHETAANSIHFAMMYLALKPAFQRKLQVELDEIFGNRKPSEWSYDEDLPKLFGGLVGAVMNEELRLIPPVVSIPKCTLPNSPQHLTVDGKDVTVPPDCVVIIDAAAAHRHPKFWPHRKSHSSQGTITTDLNEFRPERWLEKPSPEIAQGNGPTNAQSSFSSPSADGLGVDGSPDTAAGMFRPARGAYVPFSDGARACLGRRFAQVEILAALAVIFTKYSVELAVDEWATDNEILEMGEEERREVWDKAKSEVERKLQNEMGSIITIQLRGKPVRVRICERGKEIFDWKDQ